MTSDFDQKEQLSRNTLRSLGPFAEPVAVYETAPNNQVYNVTILWIDPIANVAAVSDLTVEEGTVSVNHAVAIGIGRRLSPLL